MKLTIPMEIEKQITEIVFSTWKETGVALFGEKSEDNFTVRGIAGPGPGATHEEFHYQGNEDYATMIFEDLKKGNPNLRHIGELHVHPFRMKCLSIGDLESVRSLLNEHEYEEYIAGVMLRGWRISFYPVYFSKEKPNGEPMEVETSCGDRSRFRWQCRR